MKFNLDQVFKFIQMTQKFRGIVRDVAIEGENRFENDMEHSFQLTLVLWYLASSSSLKYDINKLIRYSLIHDLVEVYAGDTPALTSSIEDLNSKFNREETAFTKIMSQFPEFEDLEKWWKCYRKKEDVESRLVYVIDKVMPFLNEAQQDSGFYRKNKVTQAKWKGWLQKKLGAVDYKQLDDGGFIEALYKYIDAYGGKFFDQ